MQLFPLSLFSLYLQKIANNQNKNAMNGKKKCELLRSIRKHIAELNGIAYTPTECHHEVCSTGTCPMCDAEAEHIMTELEKLETEGKTILIGDGMPGKLEEIAEDIGMNDCIVVETTGDVSIPAFEEIIEIEDNLPRVITIDPRGFEGDDKFFELQGDIDIVYPTDKPRNE